MRSIAQVRKFVRRLPELAAHKSGNVTVTFALAVIPLVGLVGASIDYSRANSVKAALQAAADGTSLMLSRQVASLSQSDIQAKADAYFKALFNRPEAAGLQVTASYTTSGGSKVVIGATANVKTNFMALLGVSQMNVGAASTTRWGNTRLRVALALDTTGSMDADGKIEALKIATKSLLGQLKAAAAQDGDVYVSIIPFSKDVNFGKSAYRETWLRWDLWEETNGSCSKSPSRGSYDSKSECEDANGNWTAQTDRSKWNGCITDRDRNYDTGNTAPNINTRATLFPAEQYGSCPAQLLPLTTNWTALNGKVDGLYPSGNTNQAIGIAWAYQALTASPFTIPAKDANYKYSEVIILMSDGLNTQNRFSTNQSAIDARELQTCTNAKNAGITIYSVQVNTGGDPTQSVMRNCASSTDKFFEIKQANQLVTAFTAIGTALSNLRLAE